MNEPMGPSEERTEARAPLALSAPSAPAPVRSVWRSPWTIAGLLVIAATSASAAPQQLSCALTGSAAQPDSKGSSITVTFDADAKTLTAQKGDQNYDFKNVSISNVSMSGDVAAVSVGIDRSSSSMVWQEYGADKVVTTYGLCRQPTAE